MTDVEPLLMNAGLSTTGIAILLLVYRAFKTVRGKKCVSSCCGRRADLGFDVTEMTPKPVPTPALVIHNPLTAVPPPK